MSIDTNDEKLSLMDLHMPWGPPPMSGTIGQAEQQHLLNEYPGILWGEIAVSGRKREIPWVHVIVEF
jgi:hypothetical protein